MSDVFISYARSTAPQAQQIAQLLRALGYDVWMDDQIPAHRVFSDVLEERVRAAKAVLVIWSPDATRSDYVRSEASRARAAGKLVQVAVEKTPLPMPFDQFECANLVGWRGEPAAPGWRKVLAALGELVGSAPATAVSHQAAVPLHTPAEPLLAVLAFDNLSGDPEMTYFSDGVSEEILQTVARGTRLKVIGRSSSFQFRGPDKSAARIAATLRATHVLDGSVRRNGNKLRISANLIECARETTVWSHRFDSELSDVFALQDEIAAAVAAALNVVFHPSAAPKSIDPAAYDRFLRANQLGTGNVLDAAGGEAIIALLEEATSLAPQFARAWSLLAWIRVSKLRYGASTAPYAEQRAKVVEAAATALRLDPGLGGAHCALGELEAFGHYAAREAHYRDALAASPNDPGVLVAQAYFSSVVGRVRQARAFARRAFDLDPMEFGAAYAYASFLDFERRHDESRGLWDAFARQWPQSAMVARGALAAAIQARDWNRFDALNETQSPELTDAGHTRSLLALARTLRDPERPMLERMLERARQELDLSGTLALDRLASLCTLGLVDEAFDLIDRASFAYMFDPERGWASGPLSAGFIFSRGGNAAMMADVRFVGLCAKLGLANYWAATQQWPDCADDVAYDFRAETRRLAQSG